MPIHWFALLSVAASTSIQLVVFLRWLHRRMRDDEVNRQFVRDVAHHHLPHIYEALHKIAAKQGILLTFRPASTSWISMTVAGREVVSLPAGRRRMKPNERAFPATLQK